MDTESIIVDPVTTCLKQINARRVKPLTSADDTVPEKGFAQARVTTCNCFKIVK